MIASKAENTIAGKEVQILCPLSVPKVGSLRVNVATIESNGFQRPRVGRIDMTGMELVVTTLVFLEQGTDVQRGRFRGKYFSSSFHAKQLRFFQLFSRPPKADI